jgi:formamidopyrimidine-DNA glycosylase
MTGQLVYIHADAALLTHTHAIFHLDDGMQLRYRDIRRFGRLLLGAEAELQGGRQLPKLGPEPLEPDFLPQDLYSRLRARRAPLKALLMDQKFIAGVGNIYADEALFRARLRPDKPGTEVGPRAARRLHTSLREALTAAITNRGSSIDDYVDANGEQGRQQNELLVYGHGGEPCPNCGRPLRQIRLAGRSTVFCPRCQH